MKKLILGSAIVAVMGMSANAMAANSGTVNFMGAVSTATCNLSVKDNAGVDITSVNLGTLASTATTDGTAVTFKLVPQEAACLTKTAANMTWTSPTLSATGLNNASTNGTNATMALNATNATETDKFIKQGNTSFNYNVAGGIKSFDFAAQLKRPAAGTMTAGPFSAAASYVVAYK
ncbi:TPA: fimbrial protein [Citrobacter amalonaticus]|uniref:fimbrial protein n=1 Tax=Citrobacter amalonaticus TaxID=35703 RepID=UPI0004D81CB8|nr:fimbrial protein [Citrobacter amalonaticus]KEY53318.1 fimbrial protein [Citrobacter amalonaticus]QDK84023.1 fimbrial protein [Citrobacter amalonaticus]HAU4369599.1 fimbrial protein [Citrobacter amalonaticus]